MNTGYVKFLRGTPAAYEKLATKDNNTLYFIAESGATVGSLYVGNVLIAGQTSSFGNIDVSTLTEDAVLVYDKENAQWIAKNISDVGISASETQVFDATIEKGVNHNTTITEKTALATLHAGDIFIVKENIDDTHYQYTAYVYNGTAWSAMDGNYNAENVYFDEDLTTTSAVGNISLSNGSATISAKGKNLEQVWNQIFVKEKNPSVTKPSVSISLTNDSYSYEVGSTVTPSYSVTFNKGSYSYGPDTGVTATGYSVTSGETTKTDATGSFDPIVITDNTAYSISAYATYTDGTIPLTNLGNEYAAGQIKAGTTSEKISSQITGFRKIFYGTLTNKPGSFSSDTIRALPYYKNFKTTSSFDMTIPVGAMRVVIAMPTEKDTVGTQSDITSVLDVNASKANIRNSFKYTNVYVNDASGSNAISYKVFFLDYATANDVENTYSITI